MHACLLCCCDRCLWLSGPRTNSLARRAGVFIGVQTVVLVFIISVRFAVHLYHAWPPCKMLSTRAGCGSAAKLAICKKWKSGRYCGRHEQRTMHDPLRLRSLSPNNSGIMVVFPKIPLKPFERLAIRYLYTPPPAWLR